MYNDRLGSFWKGTFSSVVNGKSVASTARLGGVSSTGKVTICFSCESRAQFEEIITPTLTAIFKAEDCVDWCAKASANLDGHGRVIDVIGCCESARISGVYEATLIGVCCCWRRDCR